jgi:hypothetical protein
MKTFHYPLGHEDFSTLTVAELKEILSKYPDEMPVLATWEGIFTPFCNEHYPNEPEYNSIKVVTPDLWMPQDNIPCLIFDVDQ